MLLITNGTVLVLVTVMVCGALVVFIGTLPNATDVGDTLTVGRVVVPVNVTVPLVAGAATATVIVAERFALLFGVKVTLIVQLAPAARPVPPIGQFCVIPNRPGLVPPRMMLLILSGAFPMFFTVTVCAALVMLIPELNVNAVGDNERIGPFAVTVRTPGTEVNV